MDLSLGAVVSRAVSGRDVTGNPSGETRKLYKLVVREHSVVDGDLASALQDDQRIDHPVGQMPNRYPPPNVPKRPIYTVSEFLRSGFL